MLDQFANPPLQYRLAPFWTWIDVPCKSEIDRQVREMHEKGLGGFILNGRFDGLVKDSGEKLLRLTQHAYEAAERLGLRVYQYDEHAQSTGLPALLDTKLRTSIVHAECRIRALARSPLAKEWSYSIEEMKRDVDRLACLGVNFFCPDAFYYSISGLEESQPRSQFYQSTYWGNYKHFADYAARLSYVMSQGTNMPQAAVLHPGTTADAHNKKLIEWLQAYCECLLSEHVDFDIIDEQSLARATIEDGRLVLSGESYELLILPPSTSVEWKTADKIKTFAEDGGKLIATSSLPAEDSSGNRHAELREAFASAFDPSEHARILNINKPDDLLPALKPALRESIKRNISICRGNTECADITCAHRTAENLDIFLLANCADEEREVRISVRCDGSPHMLNLETGECTALPNCTQQGNRTILLHRFDRYGSLVMAFDNEPAFAVALPMAEQGQEIAISDEWEFIPEQLNCLSLPIWNFNTVIQDDTELQDYTASFDVEFIPDKLLLVFQESKSLQVGKNVKISVNDSEVTPTGSWTVDIAMKTFDVSSSIHIGSNLVRMTIAQECSVENHTQPPIKPKLLGAFSIGENGSTLQMQKKYMRSGSWTDQGYPYYSGSGAYRQTIFVPEFARGQKIILRADRPADSLEFVINGRLAGLREWAPYEVDITSFVAPGPNTIELRITNSLANIMQSEPRPSGLLGGIRAFLA